VGQWNTLDSLVEASYSYFGQVDVLVNNVGMSPPYDDPASITEALWDKVLDVNLKGPFRLTTLIGTRMRHAGRGSIINVSSAAATRPRGDVIPYAAAKAGVNAITVAFAHEFGPLVRVNAIVPGRFLTDVSRHWDMEAFECEVQTFASKRAGHPEEIAGAVLYLASDASAYTTGSLLSVDGGFA
jgi:NAD(P)-dependent dehydrogenase (short-subunit alcohol dehydrogenase family)